MLYALPQGRLWGHRGFFGSQGALGLPHPCQGCRCWSLGCALIFPPWDAASSLPSPGCQLEPCPWHQPSLGITFLLGRATAKSKGFSSISCLLQHCLALGREMGLWYLPRARIWAVFLSLKMSTPPGLRALLHSIEVWGFFVNSLRACG